MVFNIFLSNKSKERYSNTYNSLLPLWFEWQAGEPRSTWSWPAAFQRLRKNSSLQQRIARTINYPI